MVSIHIKWMHAIVMSYVKGVSTSLQYVARNVVTLQLHQQAVVVQAVWPSSNTYARVTHALSKTPSMRCLSITRHTVKPGGRIHHGLFGNARNVHALPGLYCCFSIKNRSSARAPYPCLHAIKHEATQCIACARLQIWRDCRPIADPHRQ